MCMNFTISRTEVAIVIVTSPVWIPLAILASLGFGVANLSVAAARKTKKGASRAGEALGHAKVHVAEKVTRPHRSPKQVFADIHANRASGRAGTVFHSRDVRFYFQRAQRYEREKRFEKASADYKDVLSVAPTDVFAQIGFVRNALALGTAPQLNEAITILEGMLTVDFDAAANQRVVALSSGEHVTSRLFVQDVHCYLGTAHMLLSKTLRMNNFEQDQPAFMAAYRRADEAFTACLAIEPAHPMALRLRGCLRVSTLVHSPLASIPSKWDNLIEDGGEVGCHVNWQVETLDVIRGLADLELALEAQAKVPVEATFEFQQSFETLKNRCEIVRDDLVNRMKEACQIAELRTHVDQLTFSVGHHSDFPMEARRAVRTLMVLRLSKADGTPVYNTPWSILNGDVFEVAYCTLVESWRAWYTLDIWPRVVRNTFTPVTDPVGRLKALQAKQEAARSTTAAGGESAAAQTTTTTSAAAAFEL